jgi:hypothetical protein
VLYLSVKSKKVPFPYNEKIYDWNSGVADDHTVSKDLAAWAERGDAPNPLTYPFTNNKKEIVEMQNYRVAHSMRLLQFAAALVFMSLCPVYSVFAQTTAFSYQGSLNVGGVPANGSFDLQFKMFDSVSGGTQQGSTVTKNAVAVANGLFAVTLDFGASVFPGADRFLEISAQTAGGAGFTTLSPRSPVLSTPYSIQSVSSNTAGTAAFATSAGSAQSISGPLTASNPTAALAVTNNAQGIANPDLNNLPPAGLKAESTATNDQTAGVIGISNSNYGAGVLGIAKGSAQPGNVGLQTAGVVGIAVSATGPANGIRGETLSSSGWGVHGVADSTTGNANGVVGETYSPFGAAFFGRSFGSGDLIKLANDSTIGLNPRFRVAWDGSVTTGGYITTASGFRSALTIQSGGTAALPNFFVDLNGDVTTHGGLDVRGPSVLYGVVKVPLFGSGQSTEHVCRNGSSELVSCAPLLQIKTNISSFTSGLDLVKRLRPIMFDTNQGGNRDLGLGTEDVDMIEPLLVTHNDKGLAEGVQYDRLGVVLVNAVKEQQKQIEEQRTQIETLQQQVKEQRAVIDAFKALVCSQNQLADACRPK